VVRRRSTIAIGLSVGLGCAAAGPPDLSKLRCPSGTTEVAEHREPDLKDYRCEDARGLAQGLGWTTEDSEVVGLVEYFDGEPHGTANAWGDGGQLLGKIEYQRGDVVHSRFWHENGQLQEEWRYEDSQTAEVWRWNEDGSLTDRLSWRNGDIEGLWTKYWPDGSLKRRAEWRAGKLHGDFTEWYESGHLRSQGRYADDRKVGEWRFWDDAGIVSVRVY
jgi:antitoxin component YwqK of YwqJK toxin-antitoxin module